MQVHKFIFACMCIAVPEEQKVVELTSMKFKRYLLWLSFSWSILTDWTLQLVRQRVAGHLINESGMHSRTLNVTFLILYLDLINNQGVVTKIRPKFLLSFRIKNEILSISLGYAFLLQYVDLKTKVHLFVLILVLHTDLKVTVKNYNFKLF